MGTMMLFILAAGLVLIAWLADKRQK